MDNNWVGGGVEIVDILFYCIRLQIFFLKNMYICMWIFCGGDTQWKSWVEARGGGGTWVFFGCICAARDSKLAPCFKKNFPLKLIPRSGNVPIFYTPF